VRMSANNGLVAPEGAGAGEQRASVLSNGQTAAPAVAEAPKPEAPPPSNHVPTAKQMKDYQKAQAKLQQKAAKDAKKKPATPATTPAAAPATTPAATPATTPAAAATPQ